MTYPNKLGNRYRSSWLHIENRLSNRMPPCTHELMSNLTSSKTGIVIKNLGMVDSLVNKRARRFFLYTVSVHRRQMHPVRQSYYDQDTPAEAFLSPLARQLHDALCTCTIENLKHPEPEQRRFHVLTCFQAI